MKESDDIRFPLELECLNIEESDYCSDHFEVTAKFYYPSSQVSEMRTVIKEYEGRLYEKHNTYDIGNGQAILIIQHSNVEYDKTLNELKTVLTDIIQDDCFALLNSRHPNEFVQGWTAFKLRHFRQEEFSFEDIFGEHPHNLFDTLD